LGTPWRAEEAEVVQGGRPDDPAGDLRRRYGIELAFHVAWRKLSGVRREPWELQNELEPVFARLGLHKHSLSSFVLGHVNWRTARVHVGSDLVGPFRHKQELDIVELGIKEYFHQELP
jgi:hypothetical protein